MKDEGQTSEQNQTGAAATARRRAGLVQWLAMTPLLLWLAAFVVAPTAIMFVYSFCQRDELGEVILSSYTLENYRRVFEGLGWTDVGWMIGSAGVGAVVIGVLLSGWTFLKHRELPRHHNLVRPIRLGALAGAVVYLHVAILAASFDGIYLRILWRSTEFAGLTTILCLIGGFPVAYVIGRATPAWRTRLLIAVMIPFWTSFLIRTYAWVTILKQEGLLNAMLAYVKLIPAVFPKPLELLYTPTAVVIGLVYSYLPFMILPVYASIEKLNIALIDAALDLGAKPARVFFSVIIPLTLPGIAAGVLLVFVPAVGMFAVTDLLGGARTPLIGNVIQNQFGQARDWPFGSALGIVLLVLFALAMWLLARVIGGSKRQGAPSKGSKVSSGKNETAVATAN